MSRWISLHVFHAGDLDGLVADGVAPLVSRLSDAGAVERWFFVRYWNGGPHLRLRVETADGEPRAVEAALRRGLRRYLLADPAPRLDPSTYEGWAGRFSAALDGVVADYGPQELEPVEAAQPADSIQRRPYVFEHARYGGLPARTLVESHFWRSSELAVAIIAHSRAQPEARTSLAFKLMAVMVDALALPVPDAVALIGGFETLLRRVVPGQPDNYVGFEEQREALLGVAREARDADDADPASLEAVACALWRAQIAASDVELQRLARHGQLAADPHVVIVSMAHMLNNRLGIALADECHLHGLLRETIAAEAPIVGSGRSAWR